MSKKNCQDDLPRIPRAVNGIQVNCCKSAACENFGLTPEVIEESEIYKDDNKNTANRQVREKDSFYVLTGSSNKIANIRCKSCHKRNQESEINIQAHFILKSNQAVSEELNRISEYLIEPGEQCPNNSCPSNNNTSDITIKKRGKTAAGRQRFYCNHCKTSFTGLRGRHKSPKRSKDNLEILRYLLLGNGIRKLAEGSDVSPNTIYQRIDFFHEQFLRFACDREKKLEKLVKDRLYLATDRQVHISNWTNRKDKKNCEFYGIATADLKSGYVFAFNFNYDPDIEPAATNTDAHKAGDLAKLAHHRKHARVWLDSEFYESTKKSYDDNALLAGGSLEESIQNQASFDVTFNENTSSERFDRTTKLPAKGMAIHNEYTMAAHFFLLKRFTKNTGKTRFYLDQDMGMKTWYLAAFKEEIAAGNSDAFLINAEKDLTNDVKEQLVAERKRLIAATAQRSYISMSRQEINEIITQLIIENIKSPFITKRSGEAWVEVPVPSINEPRKMVAAVTSMDKYDIEHQAHLMKKGSLHAVDRFFMQIRRRVNMFERPFLSGANRRRTWYANAPYNPEMYQKLADIYRIYYNYCKPFKKRKDQTPATILGLAKGVVSLDKIVYYKKYD